MGKPTCDSVPAPVVECGENMGRSVEVTEQAGQVARCLSGYVIEVNRVTNRVHCYKQIQK